MSSDCHLPTYFWSEAISHAQYLINRSPTRVNRGTTPEAKYIGKTPNISNLRIFGCVAYVHVPKERRRKLDSKTIQCLFIGFDNKTKAYRLYDQTRRRIVISRDAVFDETKVGFNHLNTGEPAENTIFPFRPNGIDIENQPIESSEQMGFDDTEPEASECGNRLSDIGASSHLDDLPENELSPAAINPNPRPADEQSGPPAQRYPTRLQTPSVRLRDFWSLYSELLDEPLSYASAVQQEEWRKAILIEVDSIIKNNTWTVTDRPTGCKPITAKWLF